jgi:poly-gamma-glutamate synthesis protein (capsule biosynthesis protein)
MVYTDGLCQPPIMELAKAGNFQAIAHWINQYLKPYGMEAWVGAARPGCLKVLVELPWIESGKLPEDRRDYLVRYICHRIWHLNSAVIEGVQIAARFAGESQILWTQSVRVVSPARRLRQQQSKQLQTQVHQMTQQKAQMKAFRAFLVSGAPVFAFLFGCILGFSKAPVEQTNAVASSQPDSGRPQAERGERGGDRPDTVQAALEVVPVVKHDRVMNPHDPKVTLMFSGDVALAEEFEATIGKDYDHAFAAMPEYREADLAMVNLENPLTKATIPLPNKQFNFKSDPESVRVLQKGGVDLVNLANNHTMDFQEAGLVETMETLDKAGILHVGAGRNETAARRPQIVEVKGQRVAYLGYYGADFHAATDKKAGTNFADEARIAADIKSIRDQVDWVIVNFHWGEELANYPAEWQVDLAHFTIDQGADLIVGHHPHVLQGAEIYKGRPIAYSLGNFIFGGNARKDYDTAVLKVALKDRQMKVEFLPVEVRNYQPQVVVGDRAAQILKHIADLSTSFTQPMRSAAVLDAPLVPKLEPSPSAPDSQPSNPAGTSTPFTKPQPPTDNTSPTPAPSTPSAVTPTVKPSPTETPDSFPVEGGVSTPEPAIDGTPSAPESAPSGVTPPPTEPGIPQDMASPDANLPADAADTSSSPATASESGSASHQPETWDHSTPPAPIDSDASTPNPAANDPSYPGETGIEGEGRHGDTGNSLTDPAEAERLLREAERILEQDLPPAEPLPPAGAIGGPADPIHPTDHNLEHRHDTGATDSSASPDPVDFSQPPDHQSHASPTANPVDQALGQESAEPAQEAEKIALYYLSNSRELATQFQGQFQGDPASNWISPVVEAETEPEPGVALMAAAIW